MKNVVAWFFYILGVIFFLMIIAGAYIYVADPFGFNALLSVPAMQAVENDTTQSDTAATSPGAVQKEPTDKHPILSDTQEKVLETVGIDPSTIPSSVTDSQKQCLINAVGEARANEIKAGALPTPMEIIKAQSCF